MKKTIRLMIGLLVLSMGAEAFASVLGTQIGGWSQDLGAFTQFHNTVFQSSSASVGKQTEYYYEYTPNTDAVPVVVNGEDIYGKRTILQAADYLKQNNMRPLMGINADYFSTKTGIPMGHTIIDGELVTKDGNGQNAVGFSADGKGFISWLQIMSTIRSGGSQVTLDCINKWCQPGSLPIYLLTDRFGPDTKTSQNCYFVILSVQQGRLKIGDTITLKVDEAFEYTGAIGIPEGKMVMVMDQSTGYPEMLSFLKSLQVGQELTITSESVYDMDQWSAAENGLGSIGGRLIENGVANTKFEAGTAPRTAVGVKPDGNIIFYVIDGRQQGYSYGVQIKTLAQRMLELGCVEAINLDGGGSTAIAGVFPGSDTTAVINKPSDGALRKCANYIFLQDRRQPTGVPGYVYLEDIPNKNYLSGATQQVRTSSVWDTHNYKMENVSWQYSVENSEYTNSTVDENGVVQLWGVGKTNVLLSANGGGTAVSLDVYLTPQEIKVKNQATGAALTQISAPKGEAFSVDLTAEAALNGVPLISNDFCYRWEVTGEVGSITEDGVFTLDPNAIGVGSIKVSAGDTTQEIKVSIANPSSPFADTAGHWAEATLTALAEAGVIKGQDQDGYMVFRPDADMTRAEYASMISNYLDVDLSKYQDAPLVFADQKEFAPWMENYAKAMYEMGIIQGKSSDKGILFAPNDKITRAEAMTILGRLLPADSETEALNFADAAQIPEWALDSMSKLLKKGVIQGYSDNTILPNNLVKRAEAATMLYKFQ